MTEFQIYIVIFTVSVILLNTNIKLWSPQAVNYQSNLSVIEHLTKHTSKPKNYRRTPKNYQSFGYSVNAKIVNEDVLIDYKFPLVDQSESTFSTKLSPLNVSSIVSLFGCHISCFAPVDANYFKLQSVDPEFLKKNMNKDGFYFNHFNSKGYGINYDDVIENSKELSSRIAAFIVSELKAKGKDTYVNRVRAALNFVQCIPYGVPAFDHEDYTYFGFSLPHESFAISYSDCDSKSVFFAGILHHLIDPKNIILVSCVIEEGGHMIAGVSDLPFAGQFIRYNSKDYLLLETTVPIPLEMQPSNKFLEVEVYKINLA
jgi:hypothetical protein